MKDCIVIGYSGHAFVVVDALIESGWTLIGYCENEVKQLNPFELTYLGKDAVELLENKNWIVAIGDNSIREKIYEKFMSTGSFVSVIHPSATVAQLADIGRGSLVAAKAVINPAARVGKGVIINTAAVIEHECEVGDFSHIAPGAVLTGKVKVGKRSFIGANAVVKQQVCIGDDVIIGAGAVIIKDVPNGATVVGNPGRIIMK